MSVKSLASDYYRFTRDIIHDFSSPFLTIPLGITLPDTVDKDVQIQLLVLIFSFIFEGMISIKYKPEKLEKTNNPTAMKFTICIFSLLIKITQIIVCVLYFEDTERVFYIEVILAALIIQALLESFLYVADICGLVKDVIRDCP